MSRTRRVAPVEGFWDVVDAWAGDVVDARRVSGWWAGRCRLEAECGPFLDVLDELDVPERPLRTAIAAEGLALPDDADRRAALAEAGVAHRRVTGARRYRWQGPAATPVALELHTTEDEAVLEAWWEDVWAAWPKIRLGREDGNRRPTRRGIATAQIARLLDKLGLDPLGRVTG